MKKEYKKILKLISEGKTVLIEAVDAKKHLSKTSGLNRFRLLNLEKSFYVRYSEDDLDFNRFAKSCFSKRGLSPYQMIKKMESFDENHLKIVKIQVID
jgi:hypothetical protein